MELIHDALMALLLLHIASTLSSLLGLFFLNKIYLKLDLLHRTLFPIDQG